jgi:hypothetical protein
MKTYFPNFYKKIGITLVFVAYILTIIGGIDDGSKSMNEDWNKQHPSEQIDLNKYDVISTETSKILTWISMLCSFSGFFIYMFSKEKVEDEFIQQLRFECLAKSFFITWIAVMILIFISGKIQIHGLFIFQFQLIVYVILLTYKKHVKYA